MDLDPLEDEVPHPAATNMLCTFTAHPPITASTVAFDSKIVDAIAVLFAHMNVIHTDLIERISLVHEQVNLIVECQAYDIVASSTHEVYHGDE